jgi:hypothetical protein
MKRKSEDEDTNSTRTEQEASCLASPVRRRAATRALIGAAHLRPLGMRGSRPLVQPVYSVVCGLILHLLSLPGYGPV